MQHEDLLLCPQNPSTGPQSDWVESSPHPHTVFVSKPHSIIFPPREYFPVCSRGVSWCGTPTLVLMWLARPRTHWCWTGHCVTSVLLGPLHKTLKDHELRSGEDVKQPREFVGGGICWLAHQWEPASMPTGAILTASTLSPWTISERVPF